MEAWRIGLVAGGVSGAVAVALGAFGAHALRAWLPLQMMTIWETASRYHLTHTLALVLCAGLLATHPGRSALKWAMWCFLGGIVLFPGSLYLRVLADVPAFGMVTPLGGLLWIAAWGLLAAAFLRRS